jgi:DNA-binding MarR family transcriptional regulator
MADPSIPASIQRMARECIAVRVRLVNRLVTAHCEEKLRPHGLHVAQVNLLCAMAAIGPVQPSVLAERLFLEKSTLSRDLLVLLGQGLVERETGKDARSQILKITLQGIAKLEAIMPLWQAAQRELTKQLGTTLVSALSDTVDDLWAEQQ